MMDSQFFFTAELPSNTPKVRKSFITEIILVFMSMLYANGGTSFFDSKKLIKRN